MSPALAVRIVEHAHENNRDMYRVTLNSVAEARKLRPAFLERTPRAKRNVEIAAMLAKPRLEIISANLLRDWLMSAQKSMLCDFLNALDVAHKDGAVEDLPATIDDVKLKNAIEGLLTKYPVEEVSVYLNAFFTMNDARWPNLQAALENEPRLQFGG